MTSSLTKRILSLAFSAVFAVGMATPVFAQATPKDKPVIGITWKSNTQNYAAFKKVIELAGGIPVELKQVSSQAVDYDQTGKVASKDLEPSGMLKLKYAKVIKSRKYGKTNVAAALKGVDAVFFTGGEDISPTLFAVPEKEANKGEGINATRDISDYTLMAYCIDKNIPTFAVCRGEQMMGIVSGCKFMQDIPTYYASKGAAYHDTHRMPVGVPNRTYARHDVEITNTNSHLYDIVGAKSLANVSSWHHQAIEDIKGTDLVQTARTIKDGVEIIEGIENPHKTYCVAVQFHPENDCKLALVEGKKAPCNVDVCLNFFKTLVKYAAQAKAAK